MQHPLHSEQQLLEALAKGEHSATSVIYNRHYKIIIGWLINQGCNEEDAADIYQEAMVVLFSKSQEVSFRLSCKIGTYLFAISKHQWYKKMEALQKQPVLLRENVNADGDDIFGLAYEDDLKIHHERENHYEQLNTALDKIGEPCRSLLRAYYHEDKNMQEIAVKFGYTNAENAKNQKFKCLARLKKIFHNQEV